MAYTYKQVRFLCWRWLSIQLPQEDDMIDISSVVLKRQSLMNGKFIAKILFIFSSLEDASRDEITDWKKQETQNAKTSVITNSVYTVYIYCTVKAYGSYGRFFVSYHCLSGFSKFRFHFCQPGEVCLLTEWLYPALQDWVELARHQHWGRLAGVHGNGHHFRSCQAVFVIWDCEGPQATTTWNTHDEENYAGHQKDQAFGATRLMALAWYLLVLFG